MIIIWAGKRLTSVTSPGRRTVSYAYDYAGRRTSMTYPGGTNQVTYGYDNANRLSSVTDWNSNAIAYAYDDAGRMTTKTLPTGTGIVSSYSYDNADRLTAISHVKGGSTTLASVAYTLDDVGNRTQRVDQQGTHTYAYDDVYRLTSVTYPGPATTTYAFDAFGNRTSMTVGSATTTYAYDDADRLTTVTPPSPASAVSYTWDNNGDLTNRGSDTFSWDHEDRMTSATVGGTTTTFAYRGDGLRNSRTTGGTTTTFTWDIAAGLPVILDDGAKYVYGAGLESQTSGSNSYYYLADGLGSTMKTVDSTGTVVNAYTYDIYGKKTSSSGTQANEFDFAGQQSDPTGLQYLRARYMDPETGAFLSREPLAAMPGWTGNPFGYGAGNPARMVDPTGLFPVDGSEGGGASGCFNVWCIVQFFTPADPAQTVWLEALSNGDGEVTHYKVCWSVPSEKAGSYSGCYAEVTAGEVAANILRAQLLQHVENLVNVLLGATLPSGFRRITRSERQCLEDQGLHPHDLKEGVPGALSQFVLGVEKGTGDLYAVRHPDYATGNEEPYRTGYNINDLCK